LSHRVFGFRSLAAGLSLAARLSLAAGLGLTTAALAAAPSRDGPERPIHITRTHQPVGTPHKASSFAPHPGSKRKVYGAPIQGPILSHTKPKKPPKPR